MRRVYGKSWRTLVPAGILIAAGIGLLAWGLLTRHSEFRPPPSAFRLSPVSTAAFSQPKNWPCPIPGEFKSVDIPVGLLCDYYEHGIEHAPPRDPSGVMQKRERFYAAPYVPFELIQSAATNSQDDQALLAAVAAFRAKWQVGDNGAQLDQIGPVALQSSLKSDVLIDAGRAMDWLAGDEAAAAFFRAGLTKAQSEYASTPAGSVSGFPMLHALDQSKALWRLKAWPVLEQRFRLANMLNPPLSAEQRRAHYLVADMLYSEHAYDDAASEITKVADEDGRAGDLGILESSDVPEMQWTQGLFFIADGRLEEAIRFFDDCARHEGLHQSDSKRLAVLAAIRCDRLEDAQRRIMQLPRGLPRDALANSIAIELRARLNSRIQSLYRNLNSREK